MSSASAGIWARLKTTLSVAPEVPTRPVQLLRRAGGFTLVRSVAQGEQGEVFLATEPTTGFPVAVKVVKLNPGEVARDRFMREATAAALLNHPDIIRCLSAGIDDKNSEEAHGWIAMEWVSAEDLGRSLAGSRERWSTGAILNLGARVAAALAYAHRMGVVHRDVKPGNILVQAHSGIVKVGDFGCAHMSHAGGSRSGVMVGSPAYMSPEQLAGTSLDGRSDLYSLGVVLFEALTGRLPFETSNLGTLLTHIANQVPPALQTLRPDLPQPLGSLMAALLAKQPSDRPTDGDELARELCKMALVCGLALPDDAAVTRHNV
ncbi:MAG: serine/threonine protein kinase [Ideonella sp. MAG2]|nr:MAG: serine/threonine protein kinase [Ideonella sp. MAG2]